MLSDCLLLCSNSLEFGSPCQWKVCKFSSVFMLKLCSVLNCNYNLTFFFSLLFDVVECKLITTWAEIAATQVMCKTLRNSLKRIRKFLVTAAVHTVTEQQPETRSMYIMACSCYFWVKCNLSVGKSCIKSYILTNLQLPCLFHPSSISFSQLFFICVLSS